MNILGKKYIHEKCSHSFNFDQNFKNKGVFEPGIIVVCEYEIKIGGHRSDFRAICKRLFIFRKVVIFLSFWNITKYSYFWNGQLKCFKFPSNDTYLNPGMSSFIFNMCKQKVTVVQESVQENQKWVTKFWFFGCTLYIYRYIRKIFLAIIEHFGGLS